MASCNYNQILNNWLKESWEKRCFLFEFKIKIHSTQCQKYARKLAGFHLGNFPYFYVIFLFCVMKMFGCVALEGKSSFGFIYFIIQITFTHKKLNIHIKQYNNNTIWGKWTVEENTWKYIIYNRMYSCCLIWEF